MSASLRADWPRQGRREGGREPGKAGSSPGPPHLARRSGSPRRGWSGAGPPCRRQRAHRAGLRGEGEAGSQRLTAAGRGRERPEPAHRYRALPSAGKAVNKPLARLPALPAPREAGQLHPAVSRPSWERGKTLKLPPRPFANNSEIKRSRPKTRTSRRTHPGAAALAVIAGSRPCPAPSGLCGAPPPTLLPEGRAARPGAEAPSSRALGASAVLQDSCPPPLGHPVPGETVRESILPSCLSCFLTKEEKILSPAHLLTCFSFALRCQLDLSSSQPEK